MGRDGSNRIVRTLRDADKANSAAEYNLDELLDLDQLGRLMETHFQATGIPCRLVDSTGHSVVSSGPLNLCYALQEVGWNDCGACEHFQDAPTPSHGTYEKVCPLGFVEIVLPLDIHGHPIGEVHMGPFSYDDAPPDSTVLTEIGNKYTATSPHIAEMLRVIPVFSRDYVQRHLRFCETVAYMLGSMAKQNLKLRQEIQRREQVESMTESTFQSFSDRVNITPDAVLVFQDGVVAYANPAGARLFDAEKPADLVGRSGLDLVHPDFYATIRERMARVEQGQTNEPIFVKNITLSGAIREMETISMPFQFNGRSAVLVIGHDVTERRRVERAIHNAKQEWEQTVDAVPDLISIVDADYRILRVNKPLAQRLGRKPGECIGQPCYQLLHGLDAPPTWCPHHQSLQDGGEHTAERKDEALGGHFVITAAPLHSEDESRRASIHVMREVTAERQARHILERRLQLLEMLTSLTTRFVGLPAAKVDGAIIEALRMIGEFIGADASRVVLYGPDDHTLQIAYAWNSPRQPKTPPDRPSFTEHPSILERILNSATIHIPNVRDLEHNNVPIRDALLTDSIESFAAIPCGALKAVRGYVAFSSSTERQPLSFESIALLQILGNTLMNALQGKETEEALRASEARERKQTDKIQVLLDATPALVWIAEDIEASSVRGNHAANCFLRLPVDEYGKRHYMSQELGFRVYRGDEELLPQERPIERSARTGETLRECELRIEFSDGDTRYLMGNVTPLLDEDSNPSGAVGAFLDITEMRDATEALRQSEARYRLLFNQMTMAFALHEMIYDDLGEAVDYRFLEVNAEFERMSGWSREEIIGRTVREVDPDTEPEWIETFDRVARTGESLHFERHSVALDRTYDIVAYSPDPGQFAALTTDITERRRAEAEHHRLETQVQHAQKLESLGVLAGGIAHDFNNLLMAILGNADLALLEIPPTSGARNNLQEIERTARRAADLCRQMLAYSGRGHFMVAPLDLQDLVDEMGHMLEVSISKKATLRFEFAENLPPIEADATQMRQVVMNLIVNASEAIGENTGIILVRTGLMECSSEFLSTTILGDNLDPGYYVYIEVSDTGIGMTPDTMHKIFEPFFSTKFTGRGLGMAAVLGIVRGHKGTIDVSSTPGKGSRFRVLFPARQAAQTQPANESPKLSNWKGDGTILLVDDEESIRAIGKLMLEKVGFRVITAADGQEAIDRFEAQPHEICCIILDLTMPNMDGVEAFEILRRIRHDVPVILSSGYNECEVRDRINIKGIQGFIQKPYQLTKLIHALRGILESGESQ